MKEGYRGAKSAHCRLRKSLPSIRVQFGGCDSVEGSLTNSFSGSLLFQCHTSRFEGQDVEIVLLKILPIPPVWTMVGVLPNFQHSLYHLPVSFLITSYVSCMHYLLYNQQQIFGVMWKFEFIAHMSGFIWGTAGWLCWTVLDFHVWGCLVVSWSRLLGWVTVAAGAPGCASKASSSNKLPPGIFSWQWQRHGKQTLMSKPIYSLCLYHSC